jgi:putative ABC transport system permease protein
MPAEDFARDVKHMTRGLRKSPGFTLAVILTLALGIGANTAIFSVVDQLLLRPLPYPNGDELVTVYETRPDLKVEIIVGRSRNGVSPANWLDWQRDSRTLGQLAIWRSSTVTLTGVGSPVRLNTQIVSGEFFPLLGVGALLGRAFSMDDDIPNGPRRTVLSHHLWQGRFGGDPNIVGRIIQLSDQPAEVIGVMPAGFRFIDSDNDLWFTSKLDRTRPWREISGRFLNVVARRKTGVTMAEARVEMEGIARRLAETYAFNKRRSVMLVSLREELTGQVQTSLVVLYGAVAVLLSIACFNVANLLLARGASRRHELAIRTSLGAGRLALVRQLLVESVMLSTAGGVLGIALAYWSLNAIVAVVPPDLLHGSALSVDTRVLLYSLALSIATGLIVGIVPALLAVRESVAGSIRSAGSRVTHAPRIRQALVVCQVGMTVMLLCGAGLLVRSMIALNGASTGAATQDVLTMELALPGTRYPPERRVQFYREALDALRALPGVASAAAGDSLAVIGTPRGGTVFHRLGTPVRPLSESPHAVIRVVTPDYFRTLRIPILRGREFTVPGDATPTPGFVVNDAFVKKHLAGIDPLGVSLSVWMEDKNPYAPVIGVVGNVSEGSVRDDPQPTIFYSHRQLNESAMTLLIRTNQPAMTNAAIAAIHRLDPNLAVTRIRTFEGALTESLARERLLALISGGFAIIGLLLASLGLYGLLAFLVTERTREIGIRMVLGAQTGRVTRSVVGGGLRLVAIGAAFGVAGSLMLLRSLQTLLFGVTANDAATYASVLALIAAVAALASYLPARRAARVEPLTALRQE